MSVLVSGDGFQRFLGLSSVHASARAQSITSLPGGSLFSRLPPAEIRAGRFRVWRQRWICFRCSDLCCVFALLPFRDIKRSPAGIWTRKPAALPRAALTQTQHMGRFGDLRFTGACLLWVNGSFCRVNLKHSFEAHYPVFTKLIVTASTHTKGHHLIQVLMVMIKCSVLWSKLSENSTFANASWDTFPHSFLLLRFIFDCMNTCGVNGPVYQVSTCQWLKHLCVKL